MKSTTPGQKTDALLECSDTSVNTQRLQIIALLKKHHSVNTPEFRHFGIMAPAPRIFELKGQGYPIAKVTETYVDHHGKKHHGVARYFLSTHSSANDSFKEYVA